MQKLCVGLGFIFFFSACTQKTPETNIDPRDTVWGDQVKALDKVRAVEKTVQDAAERARAAETQQAQ